MKQQLIRGLKFTWRVARPLVLIALVYKGAAWVSSALPPALLVNVAPWEAGVRQDNFGGGLEARDLGPGSHFEMPGLSAIQKVDLRGRLTSFGGEAKKPLSPRLHQRPGLDIRTAGNQTAKVDISVAWHIQPGHAHDLVAGAMLATLDSKVANKLESNLQVRLAALSSEEWFDARRRQALGDELEEQLVAELAPLFVELDGVYIQGVRFSSDYEKKLQEKQVSHQMALLHDARGRVEQAQAQVGKLVNGTAALEAKVLAEWQQRLEKTQVAFNLEMAELTSETELYTKGLQAEVEAEYLARISAGEQAVKLSENASARLRLDALNSEGGRIWLAREAATRLNVHEVWLDSRDPKVPSMLDLDVLVDLLFGANGREDFAMATD